MVRALVAVTIAACGGAPSATPDGGGSGDAPAGNTALVIMSEGKPKKDVTVYFQSADSSPIAEVTTDAAGRATAMLPASDAIVTAVILPAVMGQPPQLQTFTGVQIGEELRLDLAPQAPGSVPVSVTIPDDPGATSYTLLTSCGTFGVAPGSPSTLTLVGCGSTIDLIVQSNAGTGPLHAIFKPDVTLMPSASLVISGPYQPLVMSSFDYANLPASTAFVQIEQDLATTHGRCDSLFTSASPMNQAANAMISAPSTSTTAVTISSLMPASGNDTQQVLDWAPYSSSYALDFGPLVLRDYATVPAFDPATRAVTWTELTTGTVPDFVVGQIHVYRTTGSAEWYWTLAAARGSAPALAFPQLPTDVYDYNPGPGDNVDVPQLRSIKATGGYGAVRTHVLDGTARDLVTGPTGRVVVEDIYVPQL